VLAQTLLTVPSAIINGPRERFIDIGCRIIHCCALDALACHFEVVCYKYWHDCLVDDDLVLAALRQVCAQVRRKAAAERFATGYESKAAGRFLSRHVRNIAHALPICLHSKVLRYQLARWNACDRR